MPASITITGRLAFDPETRKTRGGDTVCNLKIPVDTGWGENKTTTWWKVTIFGKRAEIAAKYLRKRSWVTVTGEPSVETWTRKDGSGDGWSPSVRAHAWDFVGNKADNDSSDDSPAERGLPKSAAVYSDANLSELPF